MHIFSSMNQIPVMQWIICLHFGNENSEVWNSLRNSDAVNISSQLLSILAFFFLAPHFVPQDWIYFSIYQTLHIEAKEKEEKNWCYIINVTSFLLLLFYSSVWKNSSDKFRANLWKISLSCVSAFGRKMDFFPVWVS